MREEWMKSKSRRFGQRAFSGMNAVWTVSIAILCIAMFVVGLRGFPGNPDAEVFNLYGHEWVTNGPLELSPERGRFALTYAFVEDGSLFFSTPLAKFVAPDLGYTSSGKFASLFAPGVSFLAMPGYIVGKYFGAAQVGTFAVISLFALLNMYLVQALARRLGANRLPAVLAAVAFGFATPAFAYGVNLYQHHISTFLLLSSVYFLMGRRTLSVYAYVWFSCALGVVVDNPNIFLMLPIGLYAFYLFFKQYFLDAETTDRKAVIRRWILPIFTFATMAVPMGLFMWYNDTAYGSPFQLPGTLVSVKEITADGRPVLEDEFFAKEKAAKGEVDTRYKEDLDKTAVGFFKTRNLYNGFYIHFISPDRGILVFAPVLVLGVLGLFVLYRSNPTATALLVSLIGMNVLVYSMWGDPWGGWAFGSRYLVPSYALLAVGIALFLNVQRLMLFRHFLLVPLLVYSLWVNTLGAVTSSANPPKTEVLSIEAVTGREQKYTFFRNWEYLNMKYEKVGSKAFVYQAWAKYHVTAPQYHLIVFSLSLIIVMLVFAREIITGRSKDHTTSL